jgi:PAS domain S-box-containing protein
MNTENNLQKYKDLFDKMELGVVYQDTQGSIIEANRAAEQILGLSLAEMKGLNSDSQNWRALKEDGSPFPGSEHPAMIALRTGKKVKDTIMGIFNHRLKQQKWININAIPEFRKGEKKAYQVFTTFNDITDRKTIETDLRESEEKFRELAEESPNMIFINQKGKVVYANKTCENYTGYRIEEFYDENFNFISLIDENYVEPIMDNFKKHMAGENVPPFKYKLICKDGSRLDLIITTKLISYKNENAILGIVTDTTEFKKVEEQLKLTQFGIDKSSVGIYQVDDAGVILYANDHVCQLLGYTRDELYNMKIWDIDLNLDEKKWKKHQKRNREQINATIESVHKRKDGTVFPAEISISLIEFRNKKISFAFVRDITEQTDAKKALFKSEERLKLAVEGTKAGLWDWNIQSGETVYDERWAEIIGYRLEELQPTSLETWKRLCHPDDVNKSDELLEKHFKGELEYYEFEARMKHKDGHWVWVHDRGKVSQRDEQNNPVRMTGTHIDITDQILAEKALRKSETHLANAMKMAKLGYWEYDVINDIFIFNDNFYEVFHTSAEEVGSYTMSSARYAELFVHPDDAHMVGVEVQTAIETTDPNLKRYLEHRMIYANGEVGHIAVQYNVIKDNQGHTIAATGVNQDITERKKIEEEIKRQNREYQLLNKEYQAQFEELVASLERIQKINKELIKAKEKAEESDRLKTAFLANMSHEIRTPMNGIIGFTDLLKEPKLSGKEKKEYIDVIQQSGYRMLNIINDLIDIAKIEAGQVEVNIDNICINHLLDDIYTFFKPEAENMKLSFSCKKELSDSDSYIRSDQTKLNQVLTNLIKNALKFTRTGSVDFGYAIKGSIVEFFVQDTGIGIHHDFKDKVFERFRQVDISETTEFEGTGLGLSITRAYVEMLGGKIWLESEHGKGSTFFFSLPFSNTKGYKAKRLPRKTKQIKSQLLHTILVVEDDDTSYLFLKEILRRNGFEVIRAINGEEAIHLIEQYSKIKLVLMDIKMPVMDGLEATGRIKQLRPDLPVIAETAYASEEDRQRSLDSGCDDFISKPIDKELLLRIVRKYV